MTVERRLIRCFFADHLKGATRAGEKVTASRFDPILPGRDLSADEVFASLSVYTLAETVARFDDAPRTYARDLELAVEVFAWQGPAFDDDALDDLVDDLCDQVERLVEPLIPQLLALQVPGCDEPLSVNPSRSGLTRVEVGFDPRGVQLAGAARLVFLIVYATTVDESDQARATDLESAGVTYRFPPVSSDDPPAAESEIAFGDG